MTQLADRPIIQKYGYVRSKTIRDSARGETCTLQTKVCNGDSETVVWAHSNAPVHGKGKSIKASDLFGFYACSACHKWYDEYNDEPDVLAYLFIKANAESLNRLIEKGIVTVKP